MLNFDLLIPTRLVFGRDTHRQIGELVKPLASRVLIHYGSDRIKRTGLFDTITQSLENAGVTYVELGGVVPNPRLSKVLEGVKLCQQEKVELILCVGGGSVIDSGKAIAHGAADPNLDIWGVFSRGVPVQKTLPVASILTLPAAGSEMSNSIVITNEQTMRKYGYKNQINRARLAVIDPTLFFTLPKNQVANGVCDMMAHTFERYFSNTPETGLSDALCEATLRTLLTYGPKVYENPTDYDAWCQVSLAGTLAHNDVLGVGRMQDWGTHALEHELSALKDIPHGAGLAILFPQWMRYCKDVRPARFVSFAVNVMGVSPQGSDDATIEAGIAALEAFLDGLNLPHSIEAYGFTDADIALMAHKLVTNEDGSPRRVGNFKQLTESDAAAIYRMAK